MLQVRVSVPWVGDYQFLRVWVGALYELLLFPSPESGIINSFKIFRCFQKLIILFPSPESGIINSFSWLMRPASWLMWFPSPESGIINSFVSALKVVPLAAGFPSPESGIINSFTLQRIDQQINQVSVPWVGDYQFLHHRSYGNGAGVWFPSPESGIINSFDMWVNLEKLLLSFRPLSRGLSIPSSSTNILAILKLSFRPLSRGLSIPSINK